ncbi:MAG: hypothetical protein ACQKBV_07455 [Puniceicoccales bacterium]
MVELNEDFTEFVRLLNANEVAYLIVGGYAVAFHGFPRYTGDIDFFIAINASNATRILRVFEQFGFGDIGLSETDFLQEAYVIEIGREPRKIQVLTGIDGVSFDEAFSQRVQVDIAGTSMNFINKRCLLTNKRATGRPKDRIDAEELDR